MFFATGATLLVPLAILDTRALAAIKHAFGVRVVQQSARDNVIRGDLIAIAIGALEERFNRVFGVVIYQVFVKGRLSGS